MQRSAILDLNKTYYVDGVPQQFTKGKDGWYLSKTGTLIYIEDIYEVPDPFPVLTPGQQFRYGYEMCEVLSIEGSWFKYRIGDRTHSAAIKSRLTGNYIELCIKQ